MPLAPTAVVHKSAGSTCAIHKQAGGLVGGVNSRNHNATKTQCSFLRTLLELWSATVTGSSTPSLVSPFTFRSSSPEAFTSLIACYTVNTTQTKPGQVNQAGRWKIPQGSALRRSWDQRRGCNMATPWCQCFDEARFFATEHSCARGRGHLHNKQCAGRQYGLVLLWRTGWQGRNSAGRRLQTSRIELSPPETRGGIIIIATTSNCRHRTQHGVHGIKLGVGLEPRHEAGQPQYAYYPNSSRVS